MVFYTVYTLACLIKALKDEWHGFVTFTATPRPWWTKGIGVRKRKRGGIKRERGWGRGENERERERERDPRCMHAIRMTIWDERSLWTPNCRPSLHFAFQAPRQFVTASIPFSPSLSFFCPLLALCHTIVSYFTSSSPAIILFVLNDPRISSFVQLTDMTASIGRCERPCISHRPQATLGH